MSRGNLYIVSGPSGAGKSSVLDIVFSRTENAYFSVSVTTRQTRQGEVPGVHYDFVTRSRFLEMVRRGELLEYAEFVGNMYGTPRGPVEEMLEAGKNIFMDIELQGVKQVKNKMPEAVSIFLIPPTLEVLEERLIGRGSDPEDIIRSRIDAAIRDCGEAHLFDYIVINADVKEAADEVLAIMTAEKCRAKNRLRYIEDGNFIVK